MATTQTTPEKSDKADLKVEAKAEVKEAARERDPARDKAIDLAVSTIEKQFGKGSIMRLGEGLAPPEVKVVPTGSRPGHRAGRGRATTRPHHRGLRA